MAALTQSDPLFMRAVELARTGALRGVHASWVDSGPGLVVEYRGKTPPADVLEALRSHAGAELPEEARPGLDTRRALRLVLLAPDDTARGLLCCPVAALVGLPQPFTLALRRSLPGGGPDAPTLVTTSRKSYDAALASGGAPWLLRELEAAALAAELGRAWPRTWDHWAALKAKNPSWRVSHETSGAKDVGGGLEERPSTWSLGRVLDAFGLWLAGVELHERGS